MLSQKRGGFQLLEPSPFLKYFLDYKLSDEIDLIKVIVNYYSQNKNCQLYLALDNCLMSIVLCLLST